MIDVRTLKVVLVYLAATGCRIQLTVLLFMYAAKRPVSASELYSRLFMPRETFKNQIPRLIEQGLVRKAEPRVKHGGRPKPTYLVTEEGENFLLACFRKLNQLYDKKRT